MKLFLDRKDATLLITNLLVVLFVFIVQKKIPPVVPLFYGLPVGAEQLSNWQGLFIPPAVSIISVIVTSILAHKINDSFISSVFKWTCLVATILSTVTVLRIVFLVGQF